MAAAVGGAGAAGNDASLPLQEQLRRCLSRTLTAVVGCRVNERSVGGQKHLALHFPFFSTAAGFPIASPVPPESLPLQYRQQLLQQEQQAHHVLAAFHTTLNKPLNSISLHVGVSHPGGLQEDLHRLSLLLPALSLALPFLLMLFSLLFLFLFLVFFLL